MDSPDDMPTAFADTVAIWPEPARARFKAIRAVIQDAGASTPAAPLVEKLKWGEPSWLPARPRIGTTLRVAWKKARPDQIGLFVNCRTTLLDDIRDIYPDAFIYEKNRALWLPLTGPLPTGPLGHAATMILTYHLR